MTGEAEVRQFQVEFPEAQVTELRRRINATKWPERETVTDDELYQAPRSWAERAYPNNLVHYNTLAKGGHFAAWEQPDLFASEMRASFRSLR